MIEKTLSELTPRDVKSVYTGRPGCMCGCRGKHIYNPSYREEASASRGYEVSPSECSSRSVASILKKAQALRGHETMVADSGDYVYVEPHEGRCYCVYLRDGVKIVGIETHDDRRARGGRA